MSLTKKQQETLKRTTRAFEAQEIANAIAQTKGVVTAQYDFAKLGGAIGDIALGVKFAQPVIVTDVYLQKIVDPDSSGSATIAVKAGSTVLVAATAYDNATFTATNRMTLTSSLTAIEVAAGAELQVAVAVAALTAGHFRLCVEFVPARDI
jgi:hypothetical protein